MIRREFIAALGGAAAWPLAAGAQQPAMPVIGVSTAGQLHPSLSCWPLFDVGLAKQDMWRAKTLQSNTAWRKGQYDHLPGLAADLVHRRVAVIATGGGTVSALAAKNATAANFP